MSHMQFQMKQEIWSGANATIFCNWAEYALEWKLLIRFIYCGLSFKEVKISSIKFSFVEYNKFFFWKLFFLDKSRIWVSIVLFDPLRLNFLALLVTIFSVELIKIAVETCCKWVWTWVWSWVWPWAWTWVSTSVLLSTRIRFWSWQPVWNFIGLWFVLWCWARNIIYWTRTAGRVILNRQRFWACSSCIHFIIEY